MAKLPIGLILMAEIYAVMTLHDSKIRGLLVISCFSSP